MPNFNLYSAADVGLPDTFANWFSSPSSTVSGSVASDLLEMSDDDLLLEDEGGGSDQTLTEDLYIDGVLVGSTGDTVINLGQSTVTNMTTGDVGYLITIQVNSVAVGYATTIDLNPGDSLSMTPWVGTPKSIDYDELEVACFTRGTKILTDQGEKLIETLNVDDQIWTRDHGFQRLLWIGSQCCEGTGRLAPILFKAGAVGNAADLHVSPMHRMLVSGWRAEILFGKSEILAHATDLVNDYNIVREQVQKVEYFHMLFDKHEIVRSNGCLSESFHPFRANIDGFDQAAQAEILAIFPNLDPDFPDARPTLSANETMLLQSL